MVNFCVFFRVTLLRVTRTLWKYFRMVTPPPHWKIRQIDSPPRRKIRSLPWGGGGNGYFLEPHILIALGCASSTSLDCLCIKQDKCLRSIFFEHPRESAGPYYKLLEVLKL